MAEHYATWLKLEYVSYAGVRPILINLSKVIAIHPLRGDRTEVEVDNGAYEVLIDFATLSLLLPGKVIYSIPDENPTEDPEKSDQE